MRHPAAAVSAFRKGLHALACVATMLPFAGKGLAAEDPAAIVPPGAKLEQLWNEGEFTEGVAAAADGTMAFSDIARGADKPGRIMKYDPKSGKTTVYSADSGKSNGLMFDRKGRLTMDEPKKRLLHSLRTEAGAFSELYISSPVGEGVARNILDPATHLLFSNKLEDNAPLDELRAQGLSIDEAIATLLRQRGHDL